ncbi:MAG: hypothetical protein R3D46_17975 [Defluviimonas denitrificans]
MALLIEGFADQGHPLSALRAAGHRVVHGGRELTAPVRVTDAVLAQVEACDRSRRCTTRITCRRSGR